jgi:hypothetical protein
MHRIVISRTPCFSLRPASQPMGAIVTFFERRISIG